MLLKSKKKEILKELEKIIKESESVTFVNFHGMKVAEETILRRELREQGVGYKVFRKTLLTLALKDKAKGEIPGLPGELAVVYCGDDTAGAREIYNFAKKHKSPLNILGGIFEGKFLDSFKMNEIATIPSWEVLLAKLAFLLKSPMQRLALVLNEVAKKK